MAIATKEIVKRIAAKSEQTLTEIQIQDCLFLLKEVICESLKNGEEVQLTNIVSFDIFYREAREGRNVKTGETMEIPETLMVSVKAGKAIKDSLREASDETFEKVKIASIKKHSLNA